MIGSHAQFILHLINDRFGCMGRDNMGKKGSIRRLNSAQNEIPEERVSLDDVSLNVNYVLILNTNSGLWGYNIGDTVMFVSLTPYKLIVTGRIKHFTSSFGQHVIGSEVESALSEARKIYGCRVTEFHVAPVVAPKEGGPHHEWLIEFDKEPESLTNFANEIDKNMQKINSYYSFTFKFIY